MEVIAKLELILANKNVQIREITFLQKSINRWFCPKWPTHEGYVWQYAIGSAFAPADTNDISVKCENEGSCTSANPCDQDEGDCNNHDDCKNGLFCGTKNCPKDSLLDLGLDCCYNSSLTIGDEHFCTTVNPCREDEGDCDANNECQGDLTCDNGCPTYLGFNANVSCCIYPNANFWLNKNSCQSGFSQ